LKALLRAAAVGAVRAGAAPSWDQVRGLLFPIESMTVLPAQAMVESGSVAAAVELLRGTRYFETLTFALKRYAAEQSLFPLEVALDLHYWRRLWQEARRLMGEDQMQALRVVGSLVDTNNLMWAIRYRVYQGLSEEELINYTLPFGVRVRDEDIRAVAAGADIAAVLSPLFAGVPNIGRYLEEPKSGLPRLELELKRHVMRQCLAAFAGNPFHIGLPLAYLVLQDLEIQDLTVLVEAKSSRLSAEEFRPFMLRAVAVRV
jgi:V/A-type H+-transporting ATPase subunit C